ncbi:hypothetical protein MAY48_24370, partial [Escherichia coli]
DPESDGLHRAREVGVETIDTGIQGFLQRAELADIVFDATSAKAHLLHAKLLREVGKVVLDLTPAAVGDLVVPPVNLRDILSSPTGKSVKKRRVASPGNIDMYSEKEIEPSKTLTKSGMIEL